VPPGVAGELCIAGAGVARGYRNRPELTAEKFVDLALPDGSADHVYRTGDLVRFLADGSLHYFSRIDDQVKVRGFRIELGEVEAVLSEYSSTPSVVVARADASGEMQLIGYVVSSDTAFDHIAARTALRVKLPEYMIPSAFVVVPRLPLTPSGKVDRKALPAPDAIAPATTAVSEATMTPGQRRVARIWRDVLGISGAGLHDNFFDLGGQSLLLVRLHGALERDFGSTIPLVQLFQRTTVAAQAELLEEPLSDTKPAAGSAALLRARARAARQQRD
jgi:acyl carrier protein